MSRKSGNNNVVTGATRNVRTDIVKEKKSRPKPTRLSEEEKEMKHGSGKYLNYKIDFKAKNENQEKYYNAILEKQIVVGTGPAGTGKSWCAAAALLKLLRDGLRDNKNKYESILIIAPTVEAGENSIGFLTGGKDQKIFEYLISDFSNIEDILEESGNENPQTILEKLLEEGYIKGDCINFQRGRNFKKKLILLTEAENISVRDMWLILSRITPTAKIIINGDNSQQDTRREFKNGAMNGMDYMIKKFEGKTDKIEFVHFNKKDIERDPLIQEMMGLWFDE